MGRGGHRSSQQLRLTGRSRSGALVCRAEVESVKDLLSRDKKLARVVDKLPSEDAFADDAPLEGQELADSEAAAEGVKQGRKGKGKRARQTAAAAATKGTTGAAPTAASNEDGPRTSRDAISAGLEAYNGKRYQEAVDLFSMALELPGSGVMRMAGTVREYACASEGEENAALYNMACAYASLGQVPAALTCLEGLLENGFEDYEGMRRDPDLAPLRGPQLDALLNKYDGPLKKLFGRKQAASGEKPFFRPW